MKKLIFLIIPLFINSGHIKNTQYYTPPNQGLELIPDIPPLVKPTHNSTTSLIDALIYVESRGKNDAVGDTHLKHPSIGVLQIRPIMIREVNRILKKQGKLQHFKLGDRFSEQKSISIFNVWKDYHHPEDSFEKIARCWNGGPRGYKNTRTLKYWVKVKKQLNKKRKY